MRDFALASLLVGVRIGVADLVMLGMLTLIPAGWVLVRVRAEPLPGGKAWVLVTLVGGPVGLLAYLLFRRWHSAKNM